MFGLFFHFSMLGNCCTSNVLKGISNFWIQVKDQIGPSNSVHCREGQSSL